MLQERNRCGTSSPILMELDVRLINSPSVYVQQSGKRKVVSVQSKRLGKEETVAPLNCECQHAVCVLFYSGDRAKHQTQQNKTVRHKVGPHCTVVYVWCHHSCRDSFDLVSVHYITFVCEALLLFMIFFRPRGRFLCG